MFLLKSLVKLLHYLSNQKNNSIWIGSYRSHSRFSWYTFLLAILIHRRNVTLFVLLSSHGPLFSCSAISLLNFLHVAIFSCCIFLSILGWFHVQHIAFFQAVHFLSCCTIFMFYFFHLENFPCDYVSMLPSVYIELSSCCTLSCCNNRILGFLDCTSSCCKFFILHSIMLSLQLVKNSSDEIRLNHRSKY